MANAAVSGVDLLPASAPTFWLASSLGPIYVSAGLAPCTILLLKQSRLQSRCHELPPEGLSFLGQVLGQAQARALVLGPGHGLCLDPVQAPAHARQVSDLVQQHNL